MHKIHQLIAFDLKLSPHTKLSDIFQKGFYVLVMRCPFKTGIESKANDPFVFERLKFIFAALIGDDCDAFESSTKLIKGMEHAPLVGFIA